MAKAASKSKKTASKTAKKAPSPAQLAARKKFIEMVKAKKNGGSATSKSSKKKAKKSSGRSKKVAGTVKLSKIPSQRTAPISRPAYDASESDAKREKRTIRKFSEVLDLRSSFGTVWM